MSVVVINSVVNSFAIFVATQDFKSIAPYASICAIFLTSPNADSLSVILYDPSHTIDGPSNSLRCAQRT